MLGSATDPGVIPRVINGIFHLINEQKKTDTMQWTESVSPWVSSNSSSLFIS
jgi:hypothetical protein